MQQIERLQCKVLSGHIIWIFIVSRAIKTLTPLNLTKHYCRKCKNWSDYVIDTGPIHVRNRWLGSVTSVAWHMGGQGIGVRGVPGGTTTFDGVSFKWDRLEREDSEKVLGLCGMIGWTIFNGINCLLLYTRMYDTVWYTAVVCYILQNSHNYTFPVQFPFTYEWQWLYQSLG